MSILGREEYFERVNKVVGDDTSDESLKFVEDMTETYDYLETKRKEDDVDWQKKYEENDRAWREKYKRRFFSGYRPGIDAEAEEVREEKITPQTIKVEDLFEKKEG